MQCNGNLEEGGVVADRTETHHPEQGERLAGQKRLAHQVQGVGAAEAEHEQRCQREHAEQQHRVDTLEMPDHRAEQGAPGITQRSLVVPLGPAHDLAVALLPDLRYFLVALAAILVDGLEAAQQQAEGEVGVLGVGVLAPAADGAHRGYPHATDGPAVLRYQSEVHARLLIDLVAAGTLEVEQPCEQVAIGVMWHHAAHHGADLGIEKRRDELFDQAAARQVVGVEDDQHRGIEARGDFLEHGCLARPAAGPAPRPDEIRCARRTGLDHRPGVIGAAIVDRDDGIALRRIVDVDQGV